MNHKDEHYWKNLAQSWIQSKTQQQQQIPAPPDIGSYVHSSDNNDNHAIADMEIEEDEPEKLWDWQNSNSNFQIHQQKPPHQHNMNKVHHPTPQSYHHFADKGFNKQLPQVPEPPMIETSYESHHDASSSLVDMDMGDSGDDSNSNSNSASSGMMDAQKRKMLPHWIREGLEKIKREKQMEITRQQEELRLKNEEATRKKIMEEALLEIEREKTAKSKYDSATEDSDEEKPQKAEKTSSVHVSEPIDDEEAYEKMMLLVRKTLTSILLEVTNERIQEISSETLSKYRKKASTTQSKPAIIGLGLGVYSSSSEDDSDGEEKARSDQSDWEAESILKERIRQKAISFEKRSKDVEEKLAKIAEMEDIRYKRKKDTQETSEKFSRNEHDGHKGASLVKDGGEENYETKVALSAGNSRVREKKTRFSDPKEGRSVTLTHVMQDSIRDKKVVPISLSSIYPAPPPIEGISPEKLERSKKSKRRDSSSSSTSEDSSHRKKQHKKHKKSSKHSKKSNKKRDRSRSREKRHKSDRRSIESRSSVRSRHSRSRSRDRHRRRY